MFNQTFVNGAGKTHKSAALLFSVLLESLALCVLILIPLLYTQALPSAQLKNLIIATGPPLPASPKPPVSRAVSTTVVRRFNIARLVAPIQIPKQINQINEMTPAPEVGVPGTTGSGNAGTIPFIDVLGSETPPPAPQPQPKPASHAPIRVGSISEANLIRKVQPAYPPLAKSARLQGIVEFTATISKEGNIEHLQLVRGHPLLVKAAQDAVLQWKYRPTLLNGQPVEVITDIIVNFTLTQ